MENKEINNKPQKKEKRDLIALLKESLVLGTGVGGIWKLAEIGMNLGEIISKSPYIQELGETTVELSKYCPAIGFGAAGVLGTYLAWKGFYGRERKKQINRYGEFIKFTKEEINDSNEKIEELQKGIDIFQNKIDKKIKGIELMREDLNEKSSHESQKSKEYQNI